MSHATEQRARVRHSAGAAESTCVLRLVLRQGVMLTLTGLVIGLGEAVALAGHEVGQAGYVTDWQLTSLGVHCEVVAPTLVPVKTGDHVKTDRRDATDREHRKTSSPIAA